MTCIKKRSSYIILKRNHQRYGGRNQIAKYFNVSTYDAVRIRTITDVLKTFNTTFEKLDQELQKYKSEVTLLKNKYKSILQQSKTKDEILSEIELKLDNYLLEIMDKYINTDSNNKSTSNNKQSYNNTKSSEDVVLLLSDFHIGEIVNPEVVGYMNEYNLDIAEKRINILIDKVKELVNMHRTKTNIDTIHIACLGDMVSGHELHSELDKTNEINIADQVLYTSKLLSKIIYELSSEFKTINFYGVVGNHGRTTKKKEFKQPTASYDYLAYKITEKEITTILNTKPELLNNIEFNSYIPNSYFIYKTIRNHNIIFTHGDNIKLWNNIPFYGMIRDYTNKQEVSLAMYNQPVHYVCMGHFHVPFTINRPLGGIIVNGTLKGLCEYSFAQNFISKPSQTLFGLNEKYGKTFLYELYLDE